MSIALLPQVLLRILNDPIYTAKGSALTWTQLDTDLKIIADACRELAAIGASAGFEPYDNSATYSDVNPDYVSYNNNVYEYINAIPQSGITPGTDPLTWQLVSQGQFAHLQDTDQYLDKGGPNQVSAAAIYAFINAVYPYLIQGSNTLIEDTTLDGGGEFNLILPDTPKEPFHAVNKKYVDSIVKAVIQPGQTISGFGDSIMFGSDASDSAHSFLNIFCSTLLCNAEDFGVSGAGSFRTMVEAFTNILSTENVNPCIWETGINDLRASGDNEKTYLKIQNAIKSFVLRANLNYAIAANDGTITQSGTWTTVTGGTIGMNADLSLSGNALKTTVSGSKLTFSHSGNNLVIGTVCTDGVSEVSGAFTVTIDGVLMGTWNGNGLADGVTDNDGYNNRITQGVIYFKNLSNTSHSVEIESVGSDQVIIDYIGSYSPYKVPVLVMEIIKCTDAGYLIPPANANDSIIDSANIAIREVVEELKHDFIVLLTDSSGYDPSVHSGVDGLHPNDLGHAERAYELLKKVITEFIDHYPDLTRNESVDMNEYRLVFSNGKFQVATIDDTNPPSVTAWDKRHSVFGLEGITGKALGVSVNNGTDQVVLNFLQPNIAFLKGLLNFNAIKFVSYKSGGGTANGFEQDENGNIISNQDIIISDITKGIIMTDSNGSGDRYRITIFDGSFNFELLP
jgi:hypothetical protein